MTNREIFERVQNIRDYARVTDTWPHDNAAEQNLHLRNAVEAIAKDLGELLLDLAAPDDHFASEGKKAQCPICRDPAVSIKPGVVFCKRCGGPLLVKRKR